MLGEGISQWFTLGPAAFRLSTGFSLALLGAGYLVGIAGGLSMLLGAVLAWGVAVPVLTTLHPATAGADFIAYATGLWAHQVRFMGAGVIAVAAIWSLAGLLGPTIAGVRDSLAASRRAPGEAGAPETDRDLAPRSILLVFAAALLAMAATFAAFLSGTGSRFGIWGLVAFGCAFSVVFGFLVAAACGYMAGLVGSSSSPISGIAIIATILTSLLLLLILQGGGHAGQRGRPAGGRRLRPVHRLGGAGDGDGVERQPAGPEDRLPGGGDALAPAGGAGGGLHRGRAGHPAGAGPALPRLRLSRCHAVRGDGRGPGAGGAAGHPDGGDRARHLRPRAGLDLGRHRHRRPGWC